MELISKADVFKVIDESIEREESDLKRHYVLCNLAEEVKDLAVVYLPSNSVIVTEKEYEEYLKLKYGEATDNVIITVKEYEEYLELKKERPTGKWIKGDMFECSKCHHKMIVGDGAYNFCPNCGSYNGGENE